MQAGAGGFAIQDFTAPPGKINHSGSRARGCLGDVWWAPGQFLDFSLIGNRAKFHDTGTLAPVPVSMLGANGQMPTGTAPAVFLTGGKSTFGTNLGTGGPLTSTSVVEDCLEGLHITLPAPATTKGGVTFSGVSKQFNYDVGINYTSTVLGTESPTGMLSLWLRLSALPSAGTRYQLFCAINGPSLRLIDISLDENGRVQATFTAFDGTTTATFSQTTGGVPADGTYHHLIFTYNTQVGTAQVVIDRSLVTVTKTGSSGFDVGISMTDGNGSAFNTLWGSLSENTGTSGLSVIGDVAEFWMSLYDTFDLSVSSNIDKFEVGGHPVDLGPTGALPTGNPPFAYHSQQPQTYQSIIFALNRASTGNDNLGFGVVVISDNPTFPTVAPAPYP